MQQQQQQQRRHTGSDTWWVRNLGPLPPKFGGGKHFFRDLLVNISGELQNGVAICDLPHLHT